MTAIEAICQDMREARCDPTLIADIAKSLEHVSLSRQWTFRYLEQGYTEREIARRIGIGQSTVFRYAHSLRNTLSSLLDPSYA